MGLRKVIASKTKTKFHPWKWVKNIAFSVFHPNLTEKKFGLELQRILEQNNDKFIVDALTDFANVVDRNYTYLRINRAFCEAHGLRREDYEGKTVADIWGKRRFEKYIKSNFDKAFRGEKVHYQTWFTFGKLGKRFMDVRYLPYFNEQGEVTHVAVISRDITHNEVRRQQREIMRKVGQEEKVLTNGKKKKKKADPRKKLDKLCKVTREGLSLRAVYAFEYGEKDNVVRVVGSSSEVPQILILMRKLLLDLNKNKVAQKYFNDLDKPEILTVEMMLKILKGNPNRHVHVKVLAQMLMKFIDKRGEIMVAPLISEGKREGLLLFVKKAGLGFSSEEELLLEDSVNTIADIMLQVEKNKIIHHMATHNDLLTDLYNRTQFLKLFDESAAHCFREHRKFSMVMFDLDFFKNINDTIGHDAGDYILFKLQELIIKELRRGDLAARWGGEEFMVFLPETDKEGAFEFAERIRQKVARMRLVYGKGKDRVNIRITISAGVSESQIGDNSDTIAKRVDNALYFSKEGNEEDPAQNRNKVTIYENDSKAIDLLAAKKLDEKKKK